MACAALLVAGCTPAGAPEIEVSGGWVRAMPPGSHMTAAYATLAWPGNAPLRITGWRSEAFDDVSLHRTVRADGVSRMEAVPDAAIAPGDTLVLEPGGLHLMMMQPTREIQPGDSVDVTLVSDNGREFRFDLPVERR